MTGLYNNVLPLLNHKQLTFLLRAPKIFLKPLSSIAMVNRYKQALNVSDDEAINLAKLTKGYGFAFQVLGNILYKNNKTMVDQQILNEFDEKLYECVYNKIWEDLSATEKKILIFIAKNDELSCTKICNITHIDNNSFQVIKTRLKKQGIVDNHEYNTLTFCLPRFKEFALLMSKIEQ